MQEIRSQTRVFSATKPSPSRAERSARARVRGEAGP
jgi:hypothetical protein